MDFRYQTSEARLQLRETLRAAEHRKRVFDFSGASVKELDHYRGIVFELLTLLEEADARTETLRTQISLMQKQLSEARKQRKAAEETSKKKMHDEPPQKAETEESAKAEPDEISPLTMPEALEADIGRLPLGRVAGMLRAAGFFRIHDLYAFRIYDFLNIDGFGNASLSSLHRTIQECGLPELAAHAVAFPYEYTGTRVVDSLDNTIQRLNLHPHIEKMLTVRGKRTVRALLAMTDNEQRRIFSYEGRANIYLSDVLALVAFPGRPLPEAVASKHGNMEMLFRSPKCLRLSTYTMNVLTAKDILTVGELLVHSRVSLGALTGFSLATIEPIQTELKKRGLSLCRAGKEMLLPAARGNPSVRRHMGDSKNKNMKN